MGVTLRKEGDKFPNAHNLPIVIADLRANITYAIVIGFVLSSVLGIAAALTPTTSKAWGWTPAISRLFVHLGLTLLMVLLVFGPPSITSPDGANFARSRLLIATGRWP
ncbi:hypothetical protein MN2019_00345 [Mycolicibacterium neoaurum]|uniref:hypothetical protein n=1 Tax=Mycolicibacterium neoaurum TaxID=1795 RepID=UPI001BD02388|nr:hypothetical protein [Mycolicibacterium neoaurum]QVI27901.1 hypothetical protein MN2019_00345 [Mycolicibacterium neoaurum]